MKLFYVFNTVIFKAAMENLKIAILGYGQMGKEIERQAIQKGFKVTDIFDIDAPIEENKSYDFDVAVDFTQPDSLENNVRVLSSLGKNIVIGTTGWYDNREKIQKMIQSANTGCIWGSNFSIGMHMFIRIIEEASKIANKQDDYDVFMHEIHHKRKKDSPSGSAITLAQVILNNVNRKTQILDETSKGKIKDDALHLSSTRGGEITGTHTVYFDSEADTIELTHRAKNRGGFASGALLAAEWIKDKKGFFEFNELLKEKWG
jgi:4-hydroxy-tetrahydrodipicolinate reductase